MTTNKAREALRGNDEDLSVKLLEEIMATKDLDAAIVLLERIQAAERANTAEDIVIDLKHFGETGAIEVIENNY
jgi:hypothetical protein